MNKKIGVYLVAILLLASISITFAQDQADSTSEVDNGYSCFENQVGDNCGGTKSTKQAAFNLLAGAYDSGIKSQCQSTLTDLKINNCWGESNTGTCDIKSTALVSLALQHAGNDIDEQIEYLLGNKKTNTGLTWYLEVDTTNKSECDINGKAITIEDNKKISGTPAQGLARAYNDYWLEIKDIEKNYTISCDKDFITTLLYQKPGSNIFHVSSDTNSASEFDSITERVDSYCLTTGGECDYEGSLWASLVLKKEGNDVSALIPYLTSMSDKIENKKYLPSAFLYILTNEDEYYSDLVGLQKSQNFWDESRNKFYDTALALLALQSVNSDEVDSAKRYLLNVQKDDGCWQSDTAFILHGAWPKNPTLTGGSGGLTYCEDFGNFCVPLGECSLADSLDNFYCTSSASICCSSVDEEPTCSEKGGFICDLDTECAGDQVTSSDSGSCCLGDCVEIVTENECEQNGFFCRESCGETQVEKAGYSASCSFGDVCCGTDPDSGGTNWILIILLIILIILVILAIIFRNQLKVFIFKRKSKYKEDKKGTPPSRPNGVMPLRTPAQMGRPPARRAPQRRRPSSRDREFEDTMKKLRDMSK